LNDSNEAEKLTLKEEVRHKTKRRDENSLKAIV
jgi:hypothetical protein